MLWTKGGKVAVALAKYLANSAYGFWLYQRKETTEMEMLRKFKTVSGTDSWIKVTENYGILYYKIGGKR